jgi:RNA polymerase sigma factor (sigma-70 family)
MPEVPDEFVDERRPAMTLNCSIEDPRLIVPEGASSSLNTLADNTADTSTSASPSGVGEAAQKSPFPSFSIRPRRRLGQTALRLKNWRRRSDKWHDLMVAAQGGERDAYEQLLREIDGWLRHYYARRLPPDAADDARQDALFAIHANRHAYTPSKPFGPWVAAIARYKWIDQLREAYRSAALSLDDGMAVEDHGEAAISTVALDDLLSRLKPAQASVIRLVKLQGITIESASRATGQSEALVKVNIHRGLKKLTELVRFGATTRGTSEPNASDGRAAISRRDVHAGRNRFGRRSEWLENPNSKRLARGSMAEPTAKASEGVLHEL